MSWSTYKLLKKIITRQLIAKDVVVRPATFAMGLQDSAMGKQVPQAGLLELLGKDDMLALFPLCWNHCLATRDETWQLISYVSFQGGSDVVPEGLCLEALRVQEQKHPITSNLVLVLVHLVCSCK